MPYSNRLTDEESRRLTIALSPLVEKAVKSGKVKINPLDFMVVARKIRPNVSADIVYKLVKGIVSTRFSYNQIKVKAVQKYAHKHRNKLPIYGIHPEGISVPKRARTRY